MSISVYKFLGRLECYYVSILSSQLQVSEFLFKLTKVKKDHLLADITIKSKGIDKTSGIESWQHLGAQIMFLGLCLSSFSTPSMCHQRQTLAT